MTENAYTTEYWVREIWHDAGDVVAVFDDEDEAREWAKDNFDEVYRSIPIELPLREVSGSAYITEVKRFPAEESEGKVDDSQTMYVVVDPGGQTANHSVLGHDTIVGVYDTQEKAETAAGNLGNYQYTADMGRGELYPDALIYESQLNE